MRLRIVGAVTAAALVAAAVGIGVVMTDDSEARPALLRVDAAATANVFELMVASSADRWVPETLAGALPNQPIEQPGADRPASVAVVAGRVTAVETGVAFAQPAEPDGASPVEVPFGSADADIAVFRVRMDVTDAVGLKDESIEFGLRFFGSPRIAPTDEILAGLRRLEDIVAVLSTRGWWDFDKDLYDVSLSGSLLGVVGPGGLVDFPAMDVDTPSFLDGLDTADEILAEARRPTKPSVPMLR